MRRIQHAFHSADAVAVLALQDVAACEFQVVEDALGIRPFAE